MKNNKTNAMRQLDTAKIQYTVKEYEVDENDLSGVHVATQLGQPVEQVFTYLRMKVLSHCSLPLRPHFLHSHLQA